MKFSETPIPGAYLVEYEPFTDDRGWFARTYDEAELVGRGLAPVGVQCNASFNSRRDTLRGMHFQLAPHAEAKLVRATMGSAHDVAVDLRPASPTYLRHASAYYKPTTEGEQ